MPTHDSIPGFSATIDAVHALASYLEQEWGSGRSLKVVGMSDGSALGACSAGDGSRWWIACDRWGNRVAGQADTFEEMRDLLSAHLERRRD
jgi:pantothenate kinase